MSANQSFVRMPVKSFSEEELLHALKAQDEQAIRYVYHSCWPMARNLVKVNNGDEEEAKDLFQESMLDFLERLWSGNLVLTCKVRTFIYSICRNKWLYHLRGRKKIVDIEDFFIDVEDDTPYKAQMQEEAGETDLPDSKQISEAITSLGQPCRSLLIGFYYERLSLEQLAKKLSYKSVNVVKQQKFRCKERLKQALQQLQTRP